MESVLTTVKRGRIAIFTLNRPEKYNALNPALIQALEEAMLDFMEDPDLYVGILTGSGGKAFCSGADVTEWLPFVKATADRPWRIPRTPMRGLYVTKPLIAAVNGLAYGGGGELALACDLRIAAEHASFRWPEPSLGLLPRFGGTQRLPRIIGYGRAMQILLTNEKVDAQTALQIGLVNQVVPAEQLLDAALQAAEKICQLAPLAVRSIKQCLSQGYDMPLRDGLALENTLGMALYQTEDYLEGGRAFQEKRPPQFQGK